MNGVSQDKTSHGGALNCRMDLDSRAHCSSGPGGPSGPGPSRVSIIPIYSRLKRVLISLA